MAFVESYPDIVQTKKISARVNTIFVAILICATDGDKKNQNLLKS